MKAVILTLFLGVTLFLLCTCQVAAETSLSTSVEVTLLADYKHTPLQGIDSIVGRIEKKEGPT